MCFNELVKRLILVPSHYSGSVLCSAWSGDTAVEFFTDVPGGELFMGAPGKNHREEENVLIP